MRPSELDASRWRQVDAVLEKLLDAPQERRQALLDEACGSDEELRSQVVALLDAADRADEFFAEPVSPIGATLVTRAEASFAEDARFGPFIVEQAIGHGGMGVVYLAEDTRLGRKVALKVLPPHLGAGSEARDRFMAEAKAISALDHPNVATLYEIDATEEGRLYMVFAHYDGETLERRIERGPVGLEEALDVARGIAAGLGAAHERGIVHRDVKPSNVLITRGGVVKLLDFGVAQMAGAAERGSARLGTLAYMSPEHVRGAPPDPRADLWSVGAVLYEMLTGSRPFHGLDPPSLVRAILREPAPRPGTRRTGVPRWVDDTVVKLLDKDPERRHASAAELAADLAAAGDEGRAPALREWGPAAYAAVTALAVMAALWLGLGMFSSSDAIERIAVLPVTNLGSDSIDRHIVEGVYDALISGLSESRDIDVVSRASVMRFADSQMSVSELAEALDADALVEASVLRERDSLAVTATLVGLAPERSMWSERYRAGVGDVPGLVGRIASSIASELGAPLRPEVRARLEAAPGVDPEAFDVYQRGRLHMGRGDPEGMALAERYFQEAIRIDSTFAAAYVELAEVRGRAAFFGFQAPTTVLPDLVHLIERALAMDSALALAHVRRAAVRLYWERDPEGAERAVRRALELNPSLSEVHMTLSEVLAVQGRYPEALAAVERGSELARWSQFGAIRPTVVLNYMGRFGEAVDRGRRAREFFPDFWQAGWQVCVALAALGRTDEALRECEEADRVSNGAAMVMGTLGYVAAVTGDEGRARRILGALLDPPAGTYVAPTDVATVYSGLGERSEALAWLERAYEERDLTLVHLQNTFVFDALRSDPRYGRLVERLGLKPRP